MGLDIDWSTLGAAWLLTYFVHSSLLLALAWGASARLGERWLAVEERLWKLALVAGLVTATLQVSLPVDPLAGSWSIQERAVGSTPSAVAPGGEPAWDDRLPQRAAPSAATVAALEGALLRGVPAATSRVSTREPARSPVATGAPRLARESGPAAIVRSWLAPVWLGGAASALVLLGLTHLRYRRRLRSRRDLPEGPLRRSLRGFLGRSGLRRPVRLTATPRIQVPLATGVRRPEICLPERALAELAPERQEIVLAHELAHLERRDPAWLFASRLIERAFFFQPLNRLARRRLQEISEFRCDDRAVELTGRPLSLARCLTEVAEWRLREGPAVPVPAMAVRRSGLGRRIARVLDSRYPRPAERVPRWLTAAVAAALAVTLLAAPGVSRGVPAAPEPPDEPAAPGSPAAPAAPEAPAPPVAPEVPARVLAPGVAPTAPAAPRAAPRPTVAPTALAAAAPSVTSSSPAAAPVATPAPGAAPAPRAARSAPQPPAGRTGTEAVAPTPPGDGSGAGEGMPTEEIDELRELTAHLALAGEIDPELELRIEELAGRLAAAHLPDPAALARIEDLARELALGLAPDAEALARIAELSEELALESRPDPAALARIEAMAQRLAETYQPNPEAMARIEEMTRRLVEQPALDPAERERLVEELRELHDRQRPDPETIRQLREEARRLADEARPGREELSRMREEIRALTERHRLDRERLGLEREELRRLQERLRPDREALERLRPEMERLRAELRAEIERLRGEHRRLLEERRAAPEAPPGPAPEARPEP